MKKQILLKVKIRNREKILLEEEVKAITSVNNKGVFDILPEHCNFISLIKDRITIYLPDRRKETFRVSSGILSVIRNQVDVFLDISNLIKEQLF